MGIDEYFELCSNKFDIHPRDFRGRYKFPFVVKARFAAMKALSLQNIGVTQIGKWISRDHSTVRHGIGEAEKLMDTDAEFRKKVDELSRVEITEKIEYGCGRQKIMYRVRK